MKLLVNLRYQPNQEQAFLPAALEVRDTPPSPVGRVIMLTIMLFCLLAIFWATLGQVDIVAVAQGRIIPSGYNKIIQPLESGTIRHLHVTDGQRVSRGQILVELDDTVMVADLEQLRQEALELSQQVIRLEWLIHLIHTGSPASAQSLELPDGLSPQQKKLLQTQWQEFSKRHLALHEELQKQRARGTTLLRQIDKLKATLPLVVERADDMQTLLKTNAVARHRVLEIKQEMLSVRHDLSALNSQHQEQQQAEEELMARMQHDSSRSQKQLMEELTTTQQKLLHTRQEIIKAEVRQSAQTLRSPVDGVVQQLAVNTIGGVVTPAQQLMLIVPDTDVLEVEAILENKDMGFIEEGQPVEVKFDAFPFTHYGTIEGMLTNISNDAILDKMKGLVFKARIHLQRSLMQIGKREIRLTPGMTVTVEIKTGTRRVIEFFLAPLLRYKQESIRER